DRFALPLQPPTFAPRLLHGHEVRAPHSNEARRGGQIETYCGPRISARRSLRRSRLSRIRLAIWQSRPFRVRLFPQKKLLVPLTGFTRPYNFSAHPPSK